ncbi:MAG: metallophosphoesterase [Myxococcales bacterium]
MKRTLLLALTLWLPLLSSKIRAQDPPPARPIIAISDTHFGVGKRGSKWLPYEDFRWNADLVAFLGYLTKRYPGGAQVLLNGDTFELWQFDSSLAPEGDCPALPNARLGCTEAQALARLTYILKQHADDLKALNDFATAPNNSVTIIPGNHDGALLFPSLRAAVMAAYPKLLVSDKGHWLSSDGRVLVEHGHQIGADVNAFAKWPQPFIELDSKKYLERTGGELFVNSFYNPIEKDYPTIDNITDEGAAVSYARERVGAHGMFDAVGQFLRTLFIDAAWPQTARWMSIAPGGPKWDLDETRKGGDELLRNLIPGRPSPDLLEASGLTMAGLTAPELTNLCDRAEAYRAAVADSVAACVPPMGQALEKLKNKYAVLVKHLQQRAQEYPGFMTFVYSHTHAAEAEFKPVDAEWNPSVINTGAFQRVISPEEIEARIKSGALKRADVITLKHDQLPRCYTFVEIASTKDSPKLSRFNYVTDKWVAEQGACK